MKLNNLVERMLSSGWRLLSAIAIVGLLVGQTLLGLAAPAMADAELPPYFGEKDDSRLETLAEQQQAPVNDLDDAVDNIRENTQDAFNPNRMKGNVERRKDQFERGTAEARDRAVRAGERTRNQFDRGTDEAGNVIDRTARQLNRAADRASDAVQDLVDR